jgi:hypothetical protein
MMQNQLMKGLTGNTSVRALCTLELSISSKRQVLPIVILWVVLVTWSQMTVSGPLSWYVNLIAKASSTTTTMPFELAGKVIDEFSQ